MDFPDVVQWLQSLGKGEIVNKPRIQTHRKEGNKKPDERLREHLRRRLVELIRRNEELRRDKPR